MSIQLQTIAKFIKDARGAVLADIEAIREFASHRGFTNEIHLDLNRKLEEVLNSEYKMYPAFKLNKVKFNEKPEEAVLRLIQDTDKEVARELKWHLELLKDNKVKVKQFSTIYMIISFINRELGGTIPLFSSSDTENTKERECIKTFANGKKIYQLKEAEYNLLKSLIKKA